MSKKKPRRSQSKAAQARADRVRRDGHAIDIDCAVCMDPAHWVAIGPCGHRVVCAECAVHMRVVDGDRRCCICRTVCPTVVVTKQVAGGRGGAASPPPLAAGGAGQVGNSLFYHDGMAAYFDDEGQYEKVRKMCLKWLRSGSPPARPGPAGTGGEPQVPLWKIILIIAIYLAGATSIGLATGVPIAMHVATQWHYRAVIKVAFGLLFCAAAFAFLMWSVPADEL